MSRQLPQLDLEPPSSERLGGFRVGSNGHTLADTPGVTPHQTRVTTPARPEELRGLLGVSIEANRRLTDHVRWLESELQRRSAELAKLRGELRGATLEALTDPLTGLANRRSFDLELSAVASRASRSPSAHLVMADIDHFKRVNDVHGHDAGDEVLRIVSEILLAHVRRDNLVARVGGDEFALLLQGASPRHAARIATRLCALLASRQLVVRGQPEITERITLSIGVARWRAGDSSAQWYARADGALYEAKRGGRNRIYIARALDLKF